MTIITQPLTGKQLVKMINYIYDFFHEYNEKSAIVSYGWDCDTEKLYEDIKIDVDKIKIFIKKSQIDKIFYLGKSDLYISTIGKNFEFQLCHEADVHFSSNDMGLIEKVASNWEKYKAYRPANIKKN